MQLPSACKLCRNKRNSPWSGVCLILSTVIFIYFFFFSWLISTLSLILLHSPLVNTVLWCEKHIGALCSIEVLRHTHFVLSDSLSLPQSHKLLIHKQHTFTSSLSHVLCAGPDSSFNYLVATAAGP